SQNERQYDALMGILPLSSQFVADNWNWRISIIFKVKIIYTEWSIQKVRKSE
ncbi:14049_t:CDS:1, partial [Racocetra persica]